MPKLSDERLIALSKKYANEHRIPASLVYAMILAESSGKTDAESGVGAKGLMQLMEPAAAEAGYEHEEMTDPDKNVDAGSQYIARMNDRFGNFRRALSAYNAGPGATRQHEDIDPDAAPYVEKVTNSVRQLTSPGGTFASELDTGLVPSPTLPYREKIAQAILELINTEEPQAAPPLLAAGRAPSITEMLAQGYSAFQK